MLPRLRSVCAAAVLLVGASACTSSGPASEIDPDSLVGMTLDTAQMQAMESYDGSATVDLSSMLSDEVASDGSEARDGWIVAAACTQSNDPDDHAVVELGILPPEMWEDVERSPETLAEYRAALSCVS